MHGQNEVYLAGYLKFPKIRQTKNGHTAFSGVIAVPMVITTQNSQQTEVTKNVKICAWNEMAEELSELSEGTPIKVQGAYNSRSYEGNCKACGTAETKYWTDVVINNFEVVNDG